MIFGMKVLQLHSEITATLNFQFGEAKFPFPQEYECNYLKIVKFSLGHIHTKFGIHFLQHIEESTMLFKSC